MTYPALLVFFFIPFHSRPRPIRACVGAFVHRGQLSVRSWTYCGLFHYGFPTFTPIHSVGTRNQPELHADYLPRLRVASAPFRPFPSMSSAALQSLISSTLVESLLETGLFGVYAVLFITVLYLFRSRDRRPPRIVLVGLGVQSVVCTVHWVNTLYVVLHSLGGLMDREAAGEYLDNMSIWTFLMNVSLCQASALITNLLVIHRLYVVFARHILAVVPALLLLVAQTVSSAGILYMAISASDQDKQFYEILHVSNPWIPSMLATSPFRLLHRRAVKPDNRIESGNSLMTVLSTMVESAALQVASIIGQLITFRIRVVGLIVFSGSMPVLLSISTVLIYARIGLGWAYASGESSPPQNLLPIRFVRPVQTDSEVKLDNSVDDSKTGDVERHGQ
ncbi:hypothetical protein HMN09_00797900 [Mycena chlorophos]|uniref:Uncharacterized protein n=1 Tax=Mycena chlorophos TaxID=658473 RepID=A0A8H6SV87_MYCCL|nr:hypothetical protein HMN09_00797900 [Mycena chlorophos]